MDNQFTYTTETTPADPSLEDLIEEAYNERVRYDFIMATIQMRSSSEISMEIHASNFAKSIEQLQNFKAKALQALTNRGLLAQAPTTV